MRRKSCRRIKIKQFAAWLVSMPRLASDYGMQGWD
jgi:hypothetical protein